MTTETLTAKKRTKASAKGSFVVDLICKVRKELIVDGCTEEEAVLDPFLYASSETETEQIDWEVVKVEKHD